ncbi:GntR family transcriptional regulator/MocR family aminotransferase [Hamadaea flava]|uniref:PLP-dependent aminotransferase family protein n=1 Tax=Hamadaea flava TaxID=1742688 RepID=A0ABV8LLE4_9ACTN|nr:PLP-dependent aminotransferase family protein [Hamadaea flava]MCP2329561.1 GntR family transcriptional regulator/MocR family aminotransferase [Hamadaea flava]
MGALLPFDRTGRGVAGRLTEALRTAIEQERLAPGTRLPSSRELAAELGLSRGVVVEAYEQLIAEGWLTGRRGSGTTVATAAHPHGATTRDPFAPLGLRPLRPGVPDLGLFPRSTWRRAYEQVITNMPDADLDYGDPAGPASVREQLAAYLRRVRAARLPATDLMLTAGAAQAFSLLVRALRGAGHRVVALEDPGSKGVREQLEYSLTVLPVRVDEEGLDVDALARTTARAVVVTPAHQFPTGVVLSPARRAALIAWARRCGGVIVEDDYDAEFRYDRDPVGCLQGVAPDVTIYIGSASKALAPALRLGWLSAPPTHLAAVRTQRQAVDLGGPALEQHAFATLLGSGGYDRHLRRARRAYRTRRDAVMAALAAHLPGLRVHGVAAGLHLVLELPAGTDDVAVAAAANRAGLGPVALSACRLDDGPPGLVLGYAAHTPDELTAAIATLATIIAEARA